MSENASNKPPVWFWVIGGVGLIWNLMGVMAYIAQVTMSPETLAGMGEAERELYANTPAWATGAFAIAVFGGSLGCLFLLLKKSWAGPAFMASLAGVLVQMFHSFFMSKSFEVFGPGVVIMPIMVILIAIFLVWYAIKAKARGWVT